MTGTSKPRIPTLQQANKIGPIEECLTSSSAIFYFGRTALPARKANWNQTVPKGRSSRGSSSWRTG